MSGSKKSGFVDSLLSVFSKKKQQVQPPVAQTPPGITADFARDEQIGLIDGALVALRTVVNSVAEPSLHTRCAAAVTRLEARRAVIPSATTQVAIAGAAMSGPGLRRDIASATDIAQTDANASTAIAGHRQRAAQFLGEAATVVTALRGPSDLPDRLTALQVDPSPAADADTVAASARGWEDAARLLLTEATAAQKAELKAEWDAGASALEQKVLAGLRGNTADRTRLGALWTAASDSAEAGDHKAALDIRPALTRLTDAPAASAVPAPGSGAVAAARTALADSGVIDALLAEAGTLRTGPLRAAIDAAAAFGTPQPATWQAETDRLTTVLTPNREAGADAIRAALDDAKAAIPAQAALVRIKTGEKASWTAAWAAYERARDVVKAHSAAGSAPVVADLGPIETAAAAAAAKAAAFDYTGACADLAVPAGRIPALTVLADRVAQFDRTRAERQSAVLALPANDANPQVNAALISARTCLADADTEAAARRYDAALELLSRIPRHIEQSNLAASTSAIYQGAKTAYVGNLATWNALPAKYKGKVTDELAILQSAVNAADALATGGDYIRAEQTLSQNNYLLFQVRTNVPLVKEYVDKRAVFDTGYATLEAHTGRAGIEAFFLRLQSDRTCVDARALIKEFGAAIAIMNTVLGQFPNQVNLANDYNQYNAKKKTVTAKIDAIRALDVAGVAAAELGMADRHLAAAAAFETVPAYPKADAQLMGALGIAQEGKALLDRRTAMDAMAPSPAGLDMAGVQARITAYPAMRASVDNPAASSFAALLATADAARDQAIAALADPVIASGFMDTAVSTLRDVMAKAARKPIYDTLLARTKNSVEIVLPPLNTANANCIDTELNQLKGAITRAEGWSWHRATTSREACESWSTPVYWPLGRPTR